MGRKRKDAVKVSLRLSVDPDLLNELNAAGINKSKLFEDAAKELLRNVKENNNILSIIREK